MEYMTQIGWFQANYPIFKAHIANRSYDKAQVLKEEAETKGFLDAAVTLDAELRDARFFSPIGV